MEDLFICAKAHHLLKKNKRQLEEEYQVEIRMPESSLDSDVLFISIHGEKYNRNSIKKFLAEKMKKFESANNDKCKENVIVVTLSDSEDEVTHVKDDSVMNIKSSSSTESSLSLPIFGNALISTTNLLDDSVSIIENSTDVKDTVEVRNCYLNYTRKMRIKRKCGKNNKRVKKVRTSILSSSEVPKLCEVTSTTSDLAEKEIVDCDESICVLSEVKKEKATDFIPLHKKSKMHFSGTDTNQNVCNEQHKKCGINNDIIELPIITPRRLRPVVIDGSNVARDHGKVSNCFSAKGIKLAIDYFLDRGHTQVTAFVPRFRRHCNPKHTCPTTDPGILDDLADKQLIVFTPSRRVNGKSIISYDDRFIVQLAATNGGVIVSNDNYRDLIDESTSFKEAIENRLLMFCFVGDIFMVPDDPLGRDGPKLSDYLSFPP